MERSPHDDRSDLTKRNGAPDQRGNAGAREPDPQQKASRGTAQQQQSPRSREFAPGEDGECH